MSVFKVGDRVRVVCPESDADGEEAIILRLFVPANDEGRAFVGHEVNIPTWPEDQELGVPFCIFEEHELVPLQKPSQETVDWSKSLCRPDGSYNPSGDHLPAMTPEFARAWGGA